MKLSGYLEQRRAGFEAVVDVPPSLRAAVGRKRLRLGLGTRDVHVARAKLLRAVVVLHGRIEAARRTVPALDPLMAEALAIREGYQAVCAGDLTGWTTTPETYDSDDALCIIVENVQTRAGRVLESVQDHLAH